MRLVSEGAGEASDVSYERRRRTIEKELEAHRRRGHFPFDARCESCRMNKSVTRHPRKTLKQGQEIQADFFFLHGHKFLALKESDSGAVGVTAASGETAIREIKTFLGFLGLDGVPGAADRPLCIVTDAETAVGALLKQVPAARNFKILQAPPQAHEAVGGGERAVRILKEGYLTLAADLGRSVQLRTEAEKAVRTALRHVAMCYNIHGRGSASPIQLILGEKALVPRTAVFSSVCFAEIPEAFREKAGENRFLPSAYLYPCENGFGRRVSTYFPLADEVIVFTASSLKFLRETLYQPEFCPEIISHCGRSRGKIIEKRHSPYLPHLPFVGKLSEMRRLPHLPHLPL